MSGLLSINIKHLFRRRTKLSFSRLESEGGTCCNSSLGLGLSPSTMSERHSVDWRERGVPGPSATFSVVRGPCPAPPQIAFKCQAHLLLAKLCFYASAFDQHICLFLDSPDLTAQVKSDTVARALGSWSSWGFVSVYLGSLILVSLAGEFFGAQHPCMSPNPGLLPAPFPF